MTTAAPEQPVDWEEYVKGFKTPQDFLAAFNDGSFQETLTKYGQSTHPALEELRAEMAEQAQLATKTMLERNGQEYKTRIDLTDGSQRRMFEAKGFYGQEAAGNRLNGKFSSAGEAFQFTLGACGLSSHAGLDLGPRLDADLQRIMNYSTTLPSEGGFLIPEEVRSDILTRALEFQIVRPDAQVVPMPSGEMRWPVNDFATEVGEVYGGIVAYWVDESQEIPTSDAAFAMLKLSAHKLAARGVCPNELLRSAPAFTAWLLQNLPRAVGHFEDVSLLKGNGVGKPLGQLNENNPSLITVSKETGQSAATITWINVIDMAARMLPEALERAQWIITPDAMREILTMALAVGTGGSAVMAVDARQPGPQMLFGRPIRWSRKAPAVLGTKGDISLTDLSSYVIGDTQSLAVESSAHEQFSSDRTVFRAIQRLDGQPGQLSALTPENGGPTLSSTVQLETRS